MITKITSLTNSNLHHPVASEYQFKTHNAKQVSMLSSKLLPWIYMVTEIIKIKT